MFHKSIRSILKTQYRFYVAKIEQQTEHLPLEEIGNIIKIKPERLAAAFRKNAKLNRTHSSHWKCFFNTLTNQGFKPEICLSMVTNYPELLYKKEKDLINGLENWRNCQFGESAAIHLLSTHPHFIDIPSNQIYERTNNLSSLISSRVKVKQLIELNPNVMVVNWNQITQSIDYLTNIMKIEMSEIYKSSALQLPLEELQCRHTFLVRLGLFKPRNPKASPLDPCTNPKLRQITDTDDTVFAKSVCQVSLEEFRVFQQLFERELKNKDDFNEDLD
ncbi:transcription termination factor 4, mitochondrial-like [Chrysoperla carnea]|uniref:transcription termination factor 4, mitochondrial-like n=1 Tax=Chrysoperla carnea TaxID=189513 RepID=UPI001D08245B|nr:transcription termination factor 4, mitochondrial-like [Chrysoperla carnea]